MASAPCLLTHYLNHRRLRKSSEDDHRYGTAEFSVLDSVDEVIEILESYVDIWHESSAEKLLRKARRLRKKTEKT